MALLSTSTQKEELPTPRLTLTAPISLPKLPVEIRLQIYSHLFRPSKVVLEAGNPASNQSCLIPAAVTTRKRQCGRSSQLLRVCQFILFEARPILYANTTFHIMTHTFAGSLPSSLSEGISIAEHARNLIWQVDCDILKKYHVEDFAFRQGDLGMIDSLELIAKVDTWKDSFCGEDCDREGFVRGRKSMLEYAELLQAQLETDLGSQVYLIEDQRFLGKGEVRIKLGRG
jgi:hypothetical protein